MYKWARPSQLRKFESALDEPYSFPLVGTGFESPHALREVLEILKQRKQAQQNDADQQARQAAYRAVHVLPFSKPSMWNSDS